MTGGRLEISHIFGDLDDWLLFSAHLCLFSVSVARRSFSRKNILEFRMLLIVIFSFMGFLVFDPFVKCKVSNSTCIPCLFAIKFG